MKLRLLLVAVLMLPMWVVAQSFSTEQEKEIGKVVHQYLMKNPEILVDMNQALRDKQTQTGIAREAKNLFAANSPSFGKKENKLKLVEFFDYQCPHCKDSERYIESIANKNPDVQVIYKQLPIFGAESNYAARAALAARQQGKYMALHMALMASKGRLNKDKVEELAKKVGLDLDKLKKDMDAPAVSAELKQNGKLASSLGLRGTPAFIVGYYPMKGKQYYGFIPGAPGGEKDLQDLIDHAKETHQAAK